MPTYKYECESCGYIFEKFQSITDDPEKKCPECGESVKKIISAGAGLIFKGKGFYQTDYKTCPAQGCSSEGNKKEVSGNGKCPCSEK